MIKNLIFFLVIVFARFAGAQETSTELARWGAGCIIPEAGTSVFRLHFPYAAISLYDAPGGNTRGKIFKDDVVNIIYGLNNAVPRRVNISDLTEIKTKGYCLKYYERRNGYLLILVNSHANGLWISEKEISLLRYSATSWFDFLIQKKSPFYPVAAPGLNLRSKPDASAEKIALMKTDHYLISLTGNTEGLWAEAEVKKYDMRPCTQKNLSQIKPAEEFQGWIKITDDSGFPNLWFHTSGCR